jgi:transcriptional regulator with XRE-family HTH domain
MPQRPKTVPKSRRRRRTYLREWREHRGLTQVAAAERLGIDQSTLSRIERGETPYDQDFLEKAAFAYLCEPADLIMRNPLDGDAVWSVTDHLKTASPAEREQVRAVIEALLKKTG